jgi:hypothetical protein
MDCVKLFTLDHELRDMINKFELNINLLNLKPHNTLVAFVWLHVKGTCPVYIHE